MGKSFSESNHSLLLDKYLSSSIDICGYSVPFLRSDWISRDERMIHQAIDGGKKHIRVSVRLDQICLRE